MALQTGSVGMKDVVNRWAASHLLSMSAKYKQTYGKDFSVAIIAHFIQQRDSLTIEWSDENCHGQPAILTLKLIAMFQQQTLLLAYGQQDNEHLRLVLEHAVYEIIEHARQSKDIEFPSLEQLFKTFKQKCADFTGKAAAEYDTMLEKIKADNQEFLKELTTMLVSASNGFDSDST